MSTLRRGTIKAYDAGTHEATVQIAGSLSVWLEDIPVSSGIPAAEVDVGDECAVLFFTDDNPDDAVIIAVYPGVPAAAGVTSIIQDADADTKVDVEESADEDKVRVDVGGTERFKLQTSTPHLTVTGDAVVSGSIGAGTGTLVPGSEYARVGNPGTSIDSKDALVVDMGAATSAGSNIVRGVAGRAIARDAATSLAAGLDYLAGVNGQNLAAAAVIQTQLIAQGSGKTLTIGRGLHVKTALVVLATITDQVGIEVDAITTGTNRYGIKVGNITGGTLARLIQLGRAPDFMVKGTGELARVANETPVFIAEGTTPTVRQVKWKDFTALAAGDRVMVLV